MIVNQQISQSDGILEQEQILATLHSGLDGKLSSAKVLVLIPDHTRSIPLPLLFRALTDVLHDSSKLDFMVALGTHPELTESKLLNLVGITPEERRTEFSRIGLLNHTWDDPETLRTIGVITRDEIKQIAGENWHSSLGGEVLVRINKAVFDYDQIIILGPTFPHEVVGFSGGAKYLFPGISGPEMINSTHWLGALMGVKNTIGIKETPVRKMIHAAAEKLDVSISLISLVVEDNGLAGLFIGDYQSAWSAAADLSAKRHIQWVEQPFQKALSCAPPMYDELWTAAKAMYKLEPAIAVGGEVIIYAPHLDSVSHVHGKYIAEIGYHTLPYILQNWDRFKHIPLGVLAHSTHLRGLGVIENGDEKPNVSVSLASKIPLEDCEHLNLGYVNPENIDTNKWKNREAEGILYVPKAGEILFRTR